MTIINVMVDDQRLEFSSMPVVASEGVKETYVKFALSSDWSGFGATALFYRDDSPEDVYTSVLDGAGLAEVPYEITAAPGWIRFGLSGSDGTSVHTSEILKYKIVKGKYTSGQSSEPPAPGIYEQMLAIAGQMRDTLNASVIEQNAIIQGLVTDMDDLRSDMETEQTTFESVVTGQINTLVNNFAGSSRETVLFEGSHTVNIGDEIDLVSDPTVYDYLDIVLNDGMVGTIIGPRQSSQWRVTGETVKSTGTSVTTYVIEGVLDAQSLCLRVSTACAIVDTGTASTRYDLGSGPIADESLRRYCLKVIGRKLTDDAEVLNIRVGADGVTYQTAGTAVRSQLDKKLNTPVSGGTVDYGASGQLLATDGQGNTEWVDSIVADGSITLAKLAPGVIDTTYQIPGAAASSVTVGQSLASKANATDVTALDTRVTAVEGDVEDVTAGLNNFYFSPSVKAGYWTANGTIGSQSPTTQEVYTEWIVPKSKTVQYMLAYPQENTAWLCAMYEFNSGDKQRIVYINNRNGASFAGSITIPSDVARMSLSYRTYGDCTFAIRGVFESLTNAEKEKISIALTADDIERFEYKYPFMDGLEFVETITSSATTRHNYSKSVLNGLYLCSVEMASDDYTFDVVIGSDAQRFMSMSRRNSNIVYVCNSKINFYIYPSASAGHKLHIYKINEGEALSLMASSVACLYPLTINVDSYHYGMRINSLDDVPSQTNTSRVSSEVFNYNGKFQVHLADSAYGLAVQVFNRETRGKTIDSGWQSDGYEFIVPPEQCFVIVLKMNDGSAVNIEDIPSGLVSIEALEMAKRTEYTSKDFELLSEKVDSVPVYDIGAIASDRIHTLRNLRNTSPVYDHLFVNDSINAKIPHESLYHLRLSRALGYRIIEANTKATSDGVIVVNHLSSGKFGNYFHHVDGVTDISNIDVGSVTWAWIVENVRYNSSIPKYRTRPFRLEEFLEECNRQNMIPFVYSGTTGAVEMADKYMGHYNYICYGGNRTICPYGIIFTWNVSTTSKEQILATCDAIGSPMIYGLGNPQDFTDAELLEIVEALHAKGYAIGTSYQDTNWAKYRGMGFDFNGSQTMINRIEDGNICNYSTIFGWDDFNLTGSPTNNDNVLTFANSGTIVPKLSADTYPVSGYDFEIVFSGQIEVVTNGTGGTKTFTSDGSSPVFYACPVLNASPNITINVSANTVIYDLYFKAKRFY